MITREDAIFDLVEGPITFTGEETIFHDGQKHPTESEIQAKIVELKAAEPMRLLRIERNRRLAETDWWVLPDRTPTQAQLDYRQALRDLPANSEPQLDNQGDLINITWPEVPE